MSGVAPRQLSINVSSDVSVKSTVFVMVYIFRANKHANRSLLILVLFTSPFKGVGLGRWRAGKLSAPVLKIWRTSGGGGKGLNGPNRGVRSEESRVCNFTRVLSNHPVGGVCEISKIIQLVSLRRGGNAGGCVMSSVNSWACTNGERAGGIIVTIVVYAKSLNVIVRGA